LDRSRSSTWLVLGALLVPYAALVARYAWVCDDAFITWRYSRNWALGHGPRYNLGAETPVEGYSDFLWMALGALVHRLGLDPTLAVPAVSIACGVILVALVLRTLVRDLEVPLPLAALATLGLVVVPPFPVWSTSGLEAMPQAMLMFATWRLLAVVDDDRRAPWAAAVTALLLSLVRTEGVAWVAVLAGVAALQRLGEGRRIVRPLAKALVPALVAYAAYFAWRYGYYQSLFANTAYAKVHMTPESLGRGVMYLALFAAYLLTPLLYPLAVPLAARHPRAPVTLGAALMVAGVAAYAVAVSGDYMAWFRLMLPALPFLAVTFGAAAQVLDADVRSNVAVPALALVAVVIGFLPTVDVELVPRRVRASLDVRTKLEAFRDENAQWDAMVHHVRDWREKGEALASIAEPGDTIVAAAIGCLGYYSGLYVYDRNGLVTSEVARLPWDGELRSPGHDKTVGPEFFLDRNPTILDAKLASGTPLKSKVREALREMDAKTFADRYYPEVIELPSRRHLPRALVVLRRAATPEEATARWAAFPGAEVADR
jgi:hypothetical protein